MLSPELEYFVSEWLDKASRYPDNTTEGCYDKFFTLYVAFNRLYAEATFELARRGCIVLQSNRALPDRKGATEYTLKLITLEKFQAVDKRHLAPYVETIAKLIEEQHFSIKLSVPDGAPQRNKDQRLLQDLRSNGRTRFLAILDVIYSVRCNLFHGHKAFRPLQADLLAPVIVLLTAVINDLLNALRRQNPRPHISNIRKIANNHAKPTRSLRHCSDQANI